MAWEEALAYCANLNYAGYQDWRLPNVNELASIVDLSKFSPAIDTFYFPNTTNYPGYYSSTSHAEYTHDGWFVAFRSGKIYPGTKGHISYKTDYVRCVRNQVYL